MTTPTIPFVQAKWYNKGRNGKSIRLFVIHDMEAPEKGTTAESVAKYFSTSERKASAHYCCDNNSIVQCVKDEDTAYGAAGANNDGLHFEQAGYASQTADQWKDDYGIAMFTTMALVLQEKAKTYNIPFTWLTVDEVADGKTKGFCTHGDVSKAFPKVSTGHTDPGPNFPKPFAMQIWSGKIPPIPGPTPTPTPPVTKDDDDMEIFHFADDLYLRQGPVYARIPNPDVYYEMCRLMPDRGFERPTLIDNAVVWAYMTTGTI